MLSSDTTPAKAQDIKRVLVFERMDYHATLDS